MTIDLKLYNTTSLRHAVGEAIGAGSMCWENPGGAGVFKSDQASNIVDQLIDWINANYITTTYLVGVLRSAMNDAQSHGSQTAARLIEAIAAACRVEDILAEKPEDIITDAELNELRAKARRHSQLAVLGDAADSILEQRRTLSQPEVLHQDALAWVQPPQGSREINP